MTFCPDEKNAHRSLAPMQGEGIIYSPKWYDKSGKPLENSKAVQPNNLSEVPLDHDSELGGNEPDNEVMSALPVPNNVVGDRSNKDDAKSREVSGAGSDSGSGSSGSGSSSGSEDSSQDSASSRSGSSEGDANSDTQGDAPRRKVRQKKKPHQSFNAESDEESAPKVMTDKTGGNADGEAKRTSQDSGLGDGATAHPVTGSSGAGAAALLGTRHAADAGGIGPLPLPTTLPSMATLEVLTGDLEKLGGKLFQGLEETNLAVYDKVLQGFKDTSGKCKNFIHEMGSLVVTFFAQAEEMEKGLAKCDAMAFCEVMSASKGHVCGLIEQVAEAEGIFDAGEANFESVLVSVTKEVKAYVQLRGDEQRKEYKKECLDWIRQDHGRLDGMSFIPMIVGNLTAHQALAMSQRVAHSHVPLKIMTAPLHTQAGAVKVYIKFVEFLARRVIALQERLGPGSSMVLLESESGGRSASPRRERSHSASPTRKSPPPSRHGSPI